MARIVFLTSMFLVVCGSPLHDMDRAWLNFKGRYNKMYSRSDDLFRRTVWENNSKYIQNHNLEADRGLHSYRLGLNEYTDLTTAEFVKQMNGYRMVYKRHRAPRFHLPKNTLDVPPAVDWRTKGYVTPVKTQFECGSDWAFSAAGALEGQHFKKTGRLVNLSAQNLVDCSKPEGNQGCNGGIMDYAFEYIKVNNGIDTVESYPYTGHEAQCKFTKAGVGATDTGYVDVTPHQDEDALKAAVATVGPVSVAVDATLPSFGRYKSGIYNDPSCSSTNVNHGMLVVGYGTTNGTDYWIVKNSWGVDWGEQGYIRMIRNKNNQCGIATMASYPTV